MCKSHSWTFPFLSPVSAAELAVAVATVVAASAVGLVQSVAPVLAVVSPVLAMASVAVAVASVAVAAVALESALLHSRPLEEILTWMKAHLDAFLATAKVILEQNVDPG